MTRQQGLYSPAFEHDACGVGFVANLHNQASHSIIEQGLEILRNLEHRGACGCDALTGDGAGMLLQVPDAFFRNVAEQEKFDLPPAGDYGAGLVFLPRKAAEADYCRKAFERVIEEEGQQLIGWRDVPVDNGAIGASARSCEPVIRQIFIRRSESVQPGPHFERVLFVITKIVEHAIDRSDLSEKSFFHIPSLSGERIVYKGLLLADQVPRFYEDLRDRSMTSALALVHQRYSTNTFPTWDLAQPFRYLAHNGEINTLRGNFNWMHARQSLFETPLIDDIERLFPIIRPRLSDSASFDNALELLYQTGRSLPHCVSMLIPEAWQNHEFMSEEKKAYYEYHASLMEPWDGPASIAFTNGRMIGAVLDRNGLRPSRYWVTRDGLVVMASEAGVLDIPQDRVELKGRLQPGRMFLCNLAEHRIVSDEEIKTELITRAPYKQWLGQQLVRLNELPEPTNGHALELDGLRTRQRMFGYTLEDLKVQLGPMVTEAKDPIGSMGNDTPLAVLSDRPQLLFNYFKQLFAQVTNPPLDAIREEIITSMVTTIGAEGNLFTETPEQAHQIRLEHPFLTNTDVARLKSLNEPRMKAAVLPIVWPREAGAAGLDSAMEELCRRASTAIAEGATVLILSDRDAGPDQVPIPSLLACSGLHHHLIREGTRTRVGLVLESGEPREVQHMSVLFGYGCCAVNPYVALETLEELRARGEFGEMSADDVVKRYFKALVSGVLKVMSKMGISTLHSYRGAQIFEAVGLNTPLIDRYFTWTPSRIEGIGIAEVAEEAMRRHRNAYPGRKVRRSLELEMGGVYQWRRDGERHMINPMTIAALQESTRLNNREKFHEFCRLIDEDARNRCTLRGLMKLKPVGEPVALEEVEPVTEIVKRFATGAMSYGSISSEAHETLAIAMNRLGGKSNTGEGGEDPDRFTPDENGDSRCSAIKQVASGRFGVTINYLVNSREIQIKMAQGAKPGEGGQLPGKKVYKWIAKVRHSTPYVGLISPPPHHDIYSIEDLAQLIHDLKNANPEARINVKLVAEVGVGTVAAGVSKGKADVVLISGHDGGTGASPLSSVKHAGLPWELGVAETQQTLVRNDLRSRIVLQTDGQLKTPRDVAVACLLGAEEFGFSTAPLITIGCIMMRKCHLNTCPVGVATQDPELRKKFHGKPEHVVNYFMMLAEGLREIMAELGFRTIDEMVGHTDALDVGEAIDHWKTRGIDLSRILHRAEAAPGVGVFHYQSQDHGLEKALDNKLLELAAPALERGEKVRIDLPVRNINRTVGTILSHHVAKRYGLELLPDETIHIKLKGSAGQSLAAFGAKGITFEIEGDANDYFGKGLSGARLVIYPPAEATFKAEDNIIVGNVAFYGATSGHAYVRGLAGERFCVRNSGVHVVVEGVGDHGCEYMTGGRCIVLGKTGRNFAAGMSGGVAYILDEDDTFEPLCNTEMVDLERLEDDEEIRFVRTMVENHRRFTASTVAERVLDEWDALVPRFVKVMPREYRRALERLAAEEAEAAASAQAERGPKLSAV